MENSFRDRFVVDHPELVYLDGNSLGRLPKATKELLCELVEEQWGRKLIGGWNENWLDLPRRLGDKIGSIIGARPEETVVCDSTSVNLFKLAWALFHSMPERNKIISDNSNFPSDLHVLNGVVSRSPQGGEFRALDLDWSDPDRSLESLSLAIDNQTALVSLSHVDFKSGRRLDLAAITELAHSRGARVLWDLSHSVGTMPIELRDANVDAAVGCTYKYLNGGPGAPAFLSVRNDLIGTLENPIQGWFGSDNPFGFSTTYQPHNAIDRFTVGTPPIISMAAIEPGVDLVLEAGIQNLRSWSLRLGERIIQSFDDRLSKLGYSLLAPRNPEDRGSHVSLGHPNGWQITQDLIHNHNVVTDFREPNVMRIALTPLYTTNDEIEVAINALEASVKEKSFEQFSSERNGVT